VCEDQFVECPLYKRLGEMDCSRSAVKAACRKTCNACDPYGTPNKRAGLLGPIDPYRQVCRDEAGRWCSTTTNLRCDIPFISKRCEKSCGVCEDTGETECEDQSERCPMTAFKDGYCNPIPIREQCPKSCDICGSGFADKIRKLCRDYSHECGRLDFCYSRLHTKELCPKTCGFCNFVYDI
ncbi:unnamed protein product, partial [Owenia fusiformis]